MQKRKLGRADLQVSIVGFGRTWISQISVDKAVRIALRAIELGINYFYEAELKTLLGQDETVVVKKLRPPLI